jgi:signal transduction histidine kinase/ligand-binding sensor domain-containing protein
VKPDPLKPGLPWQVLRCLFAIAPACLAGLRRVGLCLALIGAGGCADAQSADFAFVSYQLENISDTESIPEGIITALAQDVQGFIWVGTQNGLLRFDGYRFRTWAHDAANPASLAGDYVLSLCAGKDGRLWVGTASDGLVVFDPVSERFTPMTDDVSPTAPANRRISVLLEDAAGGIWIGTDQGLDYFSKQGKPMRHYRHDGAGSLASDNVRSLLLDQTGRLWVGSGNGLQRMTQDGRGFEQVAGEAFVGKEIQALFQARDGKLWAGSAQHGAAWLQATTEANPALLAAHWLVPDPGRFEALSHRSISGIAQVEADQIWLASYGGGINIVSADNGRVVQHLRHDPFLRGGIGSDLVVPMLRDRSGLLWIGTWGGGLQRHNNNHGMARVLRYSPKSKQGLSQSEVSSVLELANGQLLFGLESNGIDIIERERGLIGGYRPDPANGLPASAIRALAQTPDGSIWAGTSQAGLVVRRPGSKRWQAVEGLPSPLIRKLMVARDGSLWVGSTYGVAHWRGQFSASGVPRFETIAQENGQPMHWPVEALAEDAAGRIWAGSQNGLWVLTPGSAGWHGIHANADGGNLASDFITSLLQDSHGRLWVDTAKGLERLSLWDGNVAQFEHVYAWFGPAARDAGANLLEDQSGRIWTEVAVIDPKQRQIRFLGKADGLDIGSIWIGAYGKTRDGLLLFGGVAGALILDPARFEPWTWLPPVVPTALKINGQDTPLGSVAGKAGQVGQVGQDGRAGQLGLRTLTLSPQQRDFSLEFAVLDYSEPKKNRYQYRLLGYEKNWINTDHEHRSATFGNLWPGTYTLEVRGSNRLGQWRGEPLQVSITVLPAFWQTGWFFALLLLLSGALLLAGVRWRVARLRAKAGKLQSLIGERTADILKLVEIGRELTATLDMEQAFERVYQQVKARLDAEVFLIGMVEFDSISVLYAIEYQQRLPNTIWDLEEINRPAVRCVLEQRELIINDQAQMSRMFPGLPSPKSGDPMETVVYLPLLAGKQVIGCLSVQSPRPLAYNPDQLEFLRILASYTAIALSNSVALHQVTQSHEELAAALDHLKDTQAKLIQAERQQISLDLHDNLSQTMTGVLLQLDTAREALIDGDAHADQQNRNGLPYVERAIELARDGIKQTRQLLQQLRNKKNKPAPINLVDALRRDLPRLTVGTAIEVSVEQQGQLAVLAPRLELVLFRVAQEAVTNALRHSKARRITVLLACDPDCVSLTIVDDGSGFDPLAAQHGIGLSGMRERLLQINGSFAIDSAPGNGTRICATIPL